MVTVAAGEGWDAFVAARRRARLGRCRGAGRHPRPGRRDPDPERRRLRPGGRPDHRPGPGLGPGAQGRAHLRRTPTAASATAPRGSRPTPAGTSSSTSPSSCARAAWGRPVQYAELARTLGVELGERAPLADVRDAVLELRRGKGMVLDAADHDTWSAGSFFTNPVVAATRRPRGRPGLAAARRPGQDQRRLADRAGRLRQGVRHRPGQPLDQAHPRRSPTAAAPPPSSCWPWPARSATASRPRTASGWSTSRCWSAASSDLWPSDQRRVGDPDPGDQRHERGDRQRSRPPVITIPIHMPVDRRRRLP